VWQGFLFHHSDVKLKRKVCRKWGEKLSFQKTRGKWGQVWKEKEKLWGERAVPAPNAAETKPKIFLKRKNQIFLLL